MHRELVDEQRPHLALLEVARVDPVIAARHFVAALGFRVVLVVDLEHELFDAFFFEDLLEPPARARALILDGLRIDVAKADLEKVPDIADIATSHVTHDDRGPGRLRFLAASALRCAAVLRRIGDGILGGLARSARTRHVRLGERTYRDFSKRTGRKSVTWALFGAFHATRAGLDR